MKQLLFDWSSPIYKARPKEKCMKKIDELDYQHYKHCTEDELSQILNARPQTQSQLEFGTWYDAS